LPSLASDTDDVADSGEKTYFLVPGESGAVGD
jgi:hypothetical protein